MLSSENLKSEINKIWPKQGPSESQVVKYLKKYKKEKIIIKCGGSVLLDPNLFNLFIQDIVVMKKLGLTPIIVHGGGPRIKKKLNELNIKSTFIKGLRVTDEKIIKIVDILGRDMPHPMPNNPYFIIYDDGIIEKRIIIE